MVGGYDEETMNEQIAETKKKSPVLLILFLILCVGLLVAGICLILHGLKQNREANREISAGFERQDGEEQIADLYIRALLEHGSEIDEGAEIDIGKLLAEYQEDYSWDGEAQTDPAPSISWSDDIYWTNHDGVMMTPDYASGYLAFVLEYPSIGVRRGVYCADTYADIMADMDKWMTVLFSPYQELGKTQLTIMAHNHMEQNLSFNNVRNSKIGDHFFLYGKSGVYEYEVTDIVADWRTEVNRKYITDTSWGADYCWLVTCGRDDMYLPNGESTRYRDFILQGELVKQYSLSEYGKLVLQDEEHWKQSE